MKCLLPVALLLASMSLIRAQEPPAVTDYRARYLAANDAATRWKAMAEQMQAERDEARADRDVARKERDGGRRASVGSLPAAVREELVTSPKQKTTRTELVLAKKQHLLVPELNEWVTFWGADALAVHMTIGPGAGRPAHFPMRRGLEGSGNNETLIHDNGYGHRLLYVDTVRSHGDSGVFVIESASR